MHSRMTSKMQIVLLCPDRSMACLFAWIKLDSSWFLFAWTKLDSGWTVHLLLFGGLVSIEPGFVKMFFFLKISCGTYLDQPLPPATYVCVTVLEQRRRPSQPASSFLPCSQQTRSCTARTFLWLLPCVSQRHCHTESDYWWRGDYYSVPLVLELELSVQCDCVNEFSRPAAQPAALLWIMTLFISFL